MLLFPDGRDGQVNSENHDFLEQKPTGRGLSRNQG
jgi:hypothetical protein